jgi:adenylate kinase
MAFDITPQQKNILKDWLGAGSINIFGPPFAGKDTQGERLAELFDTTLLGGGDILRNSIVPEHVKRIMEEGAFIPTKDYIEIVLPYLSHPKFADKPLILSAVGRWHGEEPGVLEATTRSNHPLKTVIYMHIDEELVWERWRAHKLLGNRGVRKDDAKEALAARYKEFQQKTPKVIEFYRNKGLLIEVEGSLPQNEAFQEIIKDLCELAQPQTLNPRS